MRHPPPILPTVSAHISIIIPIYNVEQYIADCLESCIQQSYSAIEIICIDDGSTDNSKAIVERYMQKDSRIQLYTQKNKGVSSARNRGLKLAQAPYIMFCDPDDYYTHDAVSILYTYMIQEEVDIVCGATSILNERTKKIERTRRIESIPPIEGKYSVAERDFGLSYYSQCAKLFKSSYIKEHCLQFPLGFPYGDDLYFTYSYLSIAKTIYYTQSLIYCYRLRPNSASDSNGQLDKIRAIHYDLLYVTEMLFYCMKEHDCLKRYATALCRLYINFFNSTLNIIDEEDIIPLYAHAQTFWNIMEEYIIYCTHTNLKQEIIALHQHYPIHLLIRENKKLHAHIRYLCKYSLWFRLNYVLYFLLSKIPVQQNRWKKQYSKLHRMLHQDKKKDIL